MLYLLIKWVLPWAEAHRLGGVRVVRQVEFRAPVAVILSFLTCLLLGPRVIRWLRSKRMQDLAAGFDQAEVDKMMEGKRGTPTMGGLLIVGAIAAATLVLGDLSNFYVTMALVCLFWLAAVGAADDWLKLTPARRTGSRQGLKGWEKLLFQVLLGVILYYFTYRYGVKRPETHTVFFPFVKWPGPELSMLAFIIFGTLVLTGTSNAVNLSDGLDGLASGCMAIVSFTFFVLAIIIGNSRLAYALLFTHIHPAGEMAVLAGAIAGACLGFLWFNCHPASVFMGDTGSLSLGGLMAYIAIVIRQELLLFLVGGVFVVEAVSVLLQVGYYKYTRRRFGEPVRLFLCAPIHHHYQRKGWTETQVVVRFWLLGAMLAAMALATIRVR